VDEERARAFHERAYAAAKAEAGTGGQTFAHLGRTFHVPPEVQPITGVSAVFGTAVLAEVRPTDRVLDLGTGCGVNAVLAAATARAVTAVDVNPVAVAAARANAAANGVIVDVRASDVFEHVDGRYDLVLLDPPFRWFRPRDLLEAAMTDEGYGMLTRFFAGVGDHLAPGGRLLTFFGTSGDLDRFHALAAGFDRELVAEHTRRGVRYLVERLTARTPTPG
jgi:release factor glutamine methyltransferase